MTTTVTIKTRGHPASVTIEGKEAHRIEANSELKLHVDESMGFLVTQLEPEAETVEEAAPVTTAVTDKLPGKSFKAVPDLGSD